MLNDYQNGELHVYDYDNQKRNITVENQQLLIYINDECKFDIHGTLVEMKTIQYLGMFYLI